ncbi:MAG TPA: hypothetical protein VEB18_03915 [Candidatus Paceibacterota bacterium]|nr:hypothetical protein [Candidatus Paceibacterota bacterium]
MTPSAIVRIIEGYEAQLLAASVPKQRMDPSRAFSSLTKDEILAHAHYLCDGAKVFAGTEGKFGKANRHLTAIQMCLSFAGWYTLADLMEHNRSTPD